MNGDLISRAALYNAIYENPESNGSARATQLLGCIMKAPPVDAVEVVRCKDCAHARALPEGRKPYFADGVMACALGRGDPNKGQSVVWTDDFCSDGVRRR